MKKQLTCRGKSPHQQTMIQLEWKGFKKGEGIIIHRVMTNGGVMFWKILCKTSKLSPNTSREQHKVASQWCILP